MPTKRKPDLCDFSSDGQVKIVFGGVQRILRRPNIGELKKFNKALSEISVPRDTENPQSFDVEEAITSMLNWWEDVIETLRGEDDLPPPSDLDEYPAWMMNADLMLKLQNHWREVPYPSGGN
jgi:hypothetical protein